MREPKHNFLWWLFVAIAVDGILLIGYLAGDIVSALILVAGVTPVAAALFHLFEHKRQSRAKVTIKK